MSDITVIIPVYNVEEFIDECLQSVVAQTLRPREVLIINDGTPDNSRDICQRYADRHDWITIIDQENKGLSEARNTGLDHASGRYIVFLDSDDYIAPNMLATLHQKAESTGADMVKCGTISFTDTSKGRTFEHWRGLAGESSKKQSETGRVDASGAQKESAGDRVDASGVQKESAGDRVDASGVQKESSGDRVDAAGVPNPDTLTLDTRRGFFQAFFEKKLIANVWNAIYRTELFHKLRFPAGKIMEDNFITPQLLLRCKKIVIIADGLYYYRQRPGAIMHSFDNRHFDVIESDYQLKKILVRNNLFDHFTDTFYSWLGFHLLVMMKNAARYSGYLPFRRYARTFHILVDRQDIDQILNTPDSPQLTSSAKRKLREFCERPTRFWLKLKVDSFKRSRR